MSSLASTTTPPRHKRASSTLWRIAVGALSVFIVLFSLPLALGGAYLLALGGSPFYALIGLALLVAAVLLWKRRRSALHVVTGTLLVTIAWSLWEVGLDGWSLVPRLVCIAVLWILTALMWPALSAPSAAPTAKA